MLFTVRELRWVSDIGISPIVERRNNVFILAEIEWISSSDEIHLYYI
jgi:hypothetical protein